MLKKFIVAVGLAIGLAASAQATETCSKIAGRSNGELPSCIALDSVVADTTSSTIDTFGYRFVSLNVKVVEATSSVRIKIDCRGYDNSSTGISDQWHTCAEDIVDPDNTTRSDQAVTLARAYQYRVRTSGQTSGTVSVFVERYSN